MKISKILRYFSQESRDRREYATDTKRLALLHALSEKAVNVSYENNGIWITLEGVPMFRVTNESDLNARTIAIGQVELFVKELRENWVCKHRKDRLEGRA